MVVLRGATAFAASRNAARTIGSKPPQVRLLQVSTRCEALKIFFSILKAKLGLLEGTLPHAPLGALRIASQVDLRAWNAKDQLTGYREIWCLLVLVQPPLQICCC